MSVYPINERAPGAVRASALLSEHREPHPHHLQQQTHPAASGTQLCVHPLLPCLPPCRAQLCSSLGNVQHYSQGRALGQDGHTGSQPPVHDGPGDTGGHSVPAQPAAHPQPWGHPLVSFDIGDAEFWVTYYPEKTKVNFGWRYFRSGSSGRALGPSLCSGGTLGVALGLEDPAQCPSGCGVIRAGTEMWDHKNPAWLCLPLSNCAPSSQSSLNVHLKFKTSRFSTQNILES